MKKRRFLKNASILSTAAVISPIIACKPAEESRAENETAETVGQFELPPLNYGYDALAPNIDALTMEIHHDKHHAGYVRKFNAALSGTSYEGKSLEYILSNIGEADTGLRNNGGGHYNHSLFWKSMSPTGGNNPSGDLSDAINGTFGSFDQFKEVFSNAAKTRFGSGWAWLCQGDDKNLFVMSTPNQDNSLMSNIAEKTGTPLLGLDVWEHAYYLNYQNRRGDYVANFFNVIDWDAVAKRLA